MQNKQSYSDLSEVRSQMGRRLSKVSNDTKRIKANIYIQELKQLNKLTPQSGGSPVPQSKSPMQQSVLEKEKFFPQKVFKDDDVSDDGSILNQKPPHQLIDELQEKFQQHSYLPATLKDHFKKFNNTLKDNLNTNCTFENKQFRFYRQNSIERLREDPQGLMKKPIKNQEELKEDELPDKIEQIQFIEDNIKERPYDQVKLAAFNKSTRYQSPFDEPEQISQVFDQRKASRKQTKLSMESNEKSRVTKNISQEEITEDDPDREYKWITLLSKHMNRTSKDHQHSYQNTLPNHSFPPEMLQAPINRQIQSIMDGDIVDDAAYHNVGIANGTSLMTALEVSPYARGLQDKDLDEKQKKIAQDVLKIYINQNEIKKQLTDDKESVNFEEIIQMVHYLSNDNFFAQILTKIDGAQQPRKRPSITDEELEHYDKIYGGDSDDDSSSNEAPIFDEEKMLAIQQEINQRVIKQGGDQYLLKKDKLQSQFKKLYIDKDHQQTQVNYGQIKKETQLDLDIILKEIEKWKQDRTKLKHLPLGNAAAVEMQVNFDFQYEKILFEYLRIVLGVKGQPSKVQLLQELKKTLANFNICNLSY